MLILDNEKIKILSAQEVYHCYVVQVINKVIEMRFSDKNKVSLVGKTVIVTGANTGIGYETALECAKRGARLILACRDEAKGSKAIETIKRLTQNEEILLKLVDLASLQSVRKFAEDILQSEKRLDILINNAGAVMLGDHMTEDGFQLEMQINYIAPVLLTLLLLDLVKKSSPSRIINLSSLSALSAKNFTPETMHKYTGHLNVYSNSKLGNIFFTQELARRLKDANVSVFSLHPGVINTDISFQHFNPFFKTCARGFGKIFLKDVEQGCQTTLYTALMPGIEHLTGSHFDDCKAVKPYRTAKDSAHARKMWDATMKLLKYDDSNI